MDFIRAKRESGRLRQFNLSLLITREFMEAVKNDDHWPLSFPVTAKEVELDKLDLNNPEQIVWQEWPVKNSYVTNDEGLVACKIYKTIRARRLWDVIMSSTYDYAEPGFILIDKVNEMNNNWFCENVRATNPCVTADTWVQTSLGRPGRARISSSRSQNGSRDLSITDAWNVTVLWDTSAASEAPSESMRASSS